MTDDTTPSVTDEAALPTAEAAELLADLRTQVEEATTHIERLTAELAERTQALVEVEAMADAVLAASDAALLVVGGDRRVRALSRGGAAIARGHEPHVGRPLSAVVDDELAAAVADRLDAATEGVEHGMSGRGASGETKLASGRRVTIDLLDDGGAVVVLREA